MITSRVLKLLLSVIIIGSAATAIDSQSIKTGGVQLVELDNGYKVWTKKVRGGTIPVLMLHGGPGCTHEYFECFEDFLPDAGYQIIYYDQLGSYYSDQPNDPSLWTVERFCDEVEQVRKALGLENFYLYGQSWGGWLAIEYALKYQEHLKGLILSNTTPSMDSYVNYIGQLREQLPLEIQQTLKHYEDLDQFSAPEYEKTMFEDVYTRHLCRLKPWPEPVQRMFKHLNPQPYNTMQGPNEFVVVGNLKGWNHWNDLSKIKVPTLVMGARYDTMNPQDILQMGELIPHSRVSLCTNGSHLSMYDDQQSYFKDLITFLDDVEHGVFVKN